MTGSGPPSTANSGADSGAADSGADPSAATSAADSDHPAGGFAAVLLAGGAGRRMGGVDKPALPVGGRSMRDRVLAAVAEASPRVVVGSTGDLPSGVTGTREEPPGGGPVAATAAGLALLPGTSTSSGSGSGRGADIGTGDRDAVVALLAADLPLLTAAAVRDLRTALSRATASDGAVYLDDAGRPQWLCGVWRLAALRGALARLAARREGVLTGTSMRALMAELTVTEVAWDGAGPPPWFDCDTDDDVRRAEEWIR